MYDSGKVLIGLAIFAAIFLFPFLYNHGSMTPKPEPKLDTPAIKQMAVKRCVDDTKFMITTHMQLLNDWRDQALRDGDRWYVNKAGEKHWISLQNTCMKCHSNKKDFCDKCHTYAGVEPYCWDCHFDPNGSEL
jgi:hypothetical protein